MKKEIICHWVCIEIEIVQNFSYVIMVTCEKYFLRNHTSGKVV